MACDVDYENAKTKIVTMNDKLIFMLKILKQIGINLKNSTTHIAEGKEFVYHVFFVEEKIKQAFMNMCDRLIHIGKIIVKLSEKPPQITRIQSHVDDIEPLWAAVGKVTDLINRKSYQSNIYD